MTQKHHVIKYERIDLISFCGKKDKVVCLNLIKEYNKDGTFDIYYEIHDFLDDGFTLITRNTLEKAFVKYKELEVKYGPIVRADVES